MDSGQACQKGILPDVLPKVCLGAVAFSRDWRLLAESGRHQFSLLGQEPPYPCYIPQRLAGDSHAALFGLAGL